MLEGWASANRSAPSSSTDDCVPVKGELATTSPKLQAAKGALTAMFDSFELDFSRVLAAGAAVQKSMKASLSNHIQKIFYQVEKSTEAYQINVDGYILSFAMTLTPDIRSVCDRITKRL